MSTASHLPVCTGVHPLELAQRRARERMSLRCALLDVAGDCLPRTDDELRAAIREDWGAASDSAIDRELSELVRDGELARVPGGWVRVEVDEEGDRVE